MKLCVWLGLVVSGVAMSGAAEPAATVLRPARVFDGEGVRQGSDHRPVAVTLHFGTQK